jgi:hypothetical protein
MFSGMTFCASSFIFGRFRILLVQDSYLLWRNSDADGLPAIFLCHKYHKTEYIGTNKKFPSMLTEALLA